EIVPLGFTVDPGPSHGPSGAPVAAQPIAQLAHRPRRRAKRPPRPLDLGAGHDAHTRHNRVFVNIETGNPVMDHVHRASPRCPCRRLGALPKSKLTSVLPRHRCLLTPIEIITAPRVQLATGLSAPVKSRPLRRRQAQASHADATAGSFIYQDRAPPGPNSQ